MSHTAVADFAAQWSGSELLGGLHRDLSALDGPAPDKVIAAARGFFDQVEAREDLIQGLIARCRADPFFMPPFSPLTSEIHTALLIFHHEHLSIALGVTGVDMLAAKKAHRRGPASVGFTGLWGLFRYLKAGEATVSFWETDPIDANFSAATVGQCRLTGRRRIRDGEEILVDGSRQSFIVDHASSDILYLQAMVRTGGAPLTAEFDSETRSFIGATSTDEASSRVQMMATLLREMDRADAMPLLREQLSSPHFYTRWHLMREMLALDAEGALPDLKRLAAQDPHPEVRAAAAQTLDLFFPDEPEAQEAAACHA
jgi:hypothetical protein